MSVIYTNRCGTKYFLTVSTTKQGKQRYLFARTPKGALVEKIPDGFEVSESVNGIVSLVKRHPAGILESEIASVNRALQKHPEASQYQARVKRNAIEVYENIGARLDEIAKLLQPPAPIGMRSARWWIDPGTTRPFCDSC